jgi:hypothetical protein
VLKLLGPFATYVQLHAKHFEIKSLDQQDQRRAVSVKLWTNDKS